MLFLLVESLTCPRHYTIDAITTLLTYICAQLECGRPVRVTSAAAHISSILSSLVSFEVFFEESTKPFSSLIEPGFLRRVSKEPFSYLRKQNVMSLPDALRMFGKLNGGTTGENSIQHAYQQSSSTWRYETSRETTPRFCSAIYQKYIFLNPKSFTIL